ncbi:protein of unknown function [Streptantibioticus cattleyicolor NRRL 8057 = DSM 46488]|nr:protein of unknown function [Streptantibioticus cattleyicolor NRRL 8057 = DSM 46488]
MPIRKFGRADWNPYSPAAMWSVTRITFRRMRIFRFQGLSSGLPTRPVSTWRIGGSAWLALVDQGCPRCAIGGSTIPIA